MASTTPAKQDTPDVDQPAIAVKMEGDDTPDVADGVVDVVDELDEEESHGAEDSFDQDHLPAPRKKRARPNPSKSKAPRKRYVRGKQGGLKGLMKMPIEIFTEIASHLLPGDLVVLTRSNKLFRKILLQRSAIQMWRRAESSVTGLPPCPSNMCEPQYAALIFSKHCTLCGAAATAKPDTALLVRLCALCRDTKLKEITMTMGRRIIDLNLICYSNVLRPKTIQNNYRGSNHPIFSLSQDVDEVLNKQQEFLRAGDKQGLAKWESERKLAVTTRRQQSVPLGKYLSSVDISRGQALTDVKQGRRQSIRERLKALGWTDQDMRFVHSDPKPWNTLVDAPKPLTDRIWTNILPKLTPLLQRNRDANLAFAPKERRIARRKHVDTYLTQMKYTANIFEPIANALGAKIPPPPPLNEVLNCWSPVSSYKIRGFLDFEQPFPSTCTALKWECLNDLGERDITLDEVDAELAARRSQIEEKIAEWRADTEQRLVEKFESGSKERADDIIVKVKGSTELTDHFSRDTRLLLRADTIFNSNGSKSENSDDSDLEAYGWGAASGDSYICYYPNIITSSYDYFQESPYYCASENPEESFEGYVRHFKAEKVVKALLKELGMPDVARIELQLMKSRFLCGRCSSGPKNWDQMVKHYRLMLKTWETVKNNTGFHKTRHTVIFRNIHDLESPNNPKPIVRIISEVEAAEMAQPSLFSQEEWSICHLCDQTGKRGCRLRQEDTLVHMQDVHDVGEPVEGLHYGAQGFHSFDGKWHKEWDAFHYARENALVGVASSASDAVPEK